MGFSGVEYRSGSFFDRKSCRNDRGFQIDLMYIIKGSKVIICEIKYGPGGVRAGVYNQMVERRDLFLQSLPKYKNYTFETASITTEQGGQDLSGFDHVITLDDICNDRYW